MTSYRRVNVFCPGCGELWDHQLLTSYNTFGERTPRRWSDGYSESHAFDEPVVYKCSCRRLFLPSAQIIPPGDFWELIELPGIAEIERDRLTSEERAPWRDEPESRLSEIIAARSSRGVKKLESPATEDFPDAPVDGASEFMSPGMARMRAELHSEFYAGRGRRLFSATISHFRALFAWGDFDGDLSLERIVRTEVFWDQNRPFRTCPSSFPTLDLNNASRLVEIFELNLGPASLVHIQALRFLGRFDEALLLCQTLPDHMAAKGDLIDLVLRRDPAVIELL